jgi:hypothetical protein
MSILGVSNGMRVCITPSQPQNSSQRRQSPLIHPVYSMTLKRAAILRSQPRGLGLLSSTACLLPPHKPNPPNPPSHCKIRPTSKVSAISLGARQCSLRSTPSPSLPIAAMMDRLMIAWLNWRKNLGWL